MDSTGQAHNLTTTGDCIFPRIFGQYVIWLQELAVGTQVVLYTIGSGLPIQTSVMAGPTPTILGRNGDISTWA